MRLAVPFTKDQDDFLREHYNKKPAWWIAEQLGRTKNSVIGRAQRIGCSGSLPRRTDLVVRVPKPDAPKKVRISAAGTDRRRMVKTRFRSLDNMPFVGLAVVDLRTEQCRFIVSEMPYLFCDGDIERGSYCEHHAGVCYRDKNYGKKENKSCE